MAINVVILHRFHKFSQILVLSIYFPARFWKPCRYIYNSIIPTRLKKTLQDLENKINTDRVLR